jgi:hypothetical protein
MSGQPTARLLTLSSLDQRTIRKIEIPEGQKTGSAPLATPEDIENGVFADDVETYRKLTGRRAAEESGRQNFKTDSQKNEEVFQKWLPTKQYQMHFPPVCTENLIHIVWLRESPNISAQCWCCSASFPF